MFILDLPKTFDGETIQLPMYHRGHLSLKPETKVWLCVIKGADIVSNKILTGNNKKSQKIVMPEIVISPIDFKAWDDIWRISLIVYDRVGAVSNLLETLKELNINILVSETCTIERQEFHNINIVVDLKNYKSKNRGDWNKDHRVKNQLEKLPDLYRYIALNLKNNIVCDDSGRPRIRINRVSNLFKTVLEVVKDISIKPDTSSIGSAYVEQDREHKTFIKIPEDILQKLKKYLGCINNSELKDNINYLITSYTTDRVIRVSFYHASTNIIAIATKHQEKIGAISNITKALKTSGFNIITSLSRLYEYEKTGNSEFVLLPPANLKTIDDIKTKIQESLSTDTLINQYQIHLSYPRDQMKPYEYFILAVPVSKRTSGDNKKTSTKPLDIDELFRKELKKSKIKPISKSKINEWEDYNLMLKYLKNKFPPENEKPKIFISQSFLKNSLKQFIQTADNLSKKLNFEADIVEVLQGNNTTINGIKERIKPCDLFLGIWSDENALKIDDKLWPSSWLHFEWGIAECYGMRCRLLIHEDIHMDAWKIDNLTLHNKYNSKNFESQFEKAIKELLE
jgi:hypothetical protein